MPRELFSNLYGFELGILGVPGTQRRRWVSLAVEYSGLGGVEDAANAFEAGEAIPELYLRLQSEAGPILHNRLGQAPFAAEAGGAAYRIAGPRDDTPTDSAKTGKVFDLRIKGRADALIYFDADGHGFLPLPKSRNPQRP